MDWGMLGYFVGEAVQERIPVLIGRYGQPDLIRHKHFGAAAASSGGVEMYHIVGVTPEAPTLEAALGRRQPAATLRYGVEERRRVYDDLNGKASSPDVDFVMLGCPHYSLEQMRDAAALLAGRHVSGNCNLWIFTSRAVKHEADSWGFQRRSATPAACCSPTPAPRSARRCRRARKSRRSIRPSRRTTCRRSWESRPGSAPRPTASTRRCTAAGTGGGHEQRTDHPHRPQGRRRRAPKAKRWSRARPSPAGAASTRCRARSSRRATSCAA